MFRSLVFLLLMFWSIANISAEDFVVNGDLNVNCHDQTPPVQGEVCAKSPIISSDWKLSINRENQGEDIEVIYSGEPPLNETINGIISNEPRLDRDGDFIVLQIEKRSAEGDNCFTLGDVWFHNISADNGGACRYLMNRKSETQICNPNGIVRMGRTIPGLPSGCADNALKAKLSGFPRTQLLNKLIDIEIGQKINLTLDLSSNISSNDGYGISGCYPDVLQFYDAIDDTYPLVATPVSSSHVPTGGEPFVDCSSGLSFEHGINRSSSLQYTAVARKRGVARFLNTKPISARFRLTGEVFEPVSSSPFEEVLKIGGGLTLTASAPTQVKNSGSFNVELKIKNEGKGAATVSGQSCANYISDNSGVVTTKKLSGFEKDFNLAGGQEVTVSCNYIILKQGNVDLNFDTFWIHQSGGEVLTEFTCADHPAGLARCLNNSLLTGTRDVIRVSVSKKLGECGDGFIDGNEDCDGGACCTEDCKFVERGEQCAEESVCSTGAGLCLGDRPFCPGEVDGDGIRSVDFELTYPVGFSPQIFTEGWTLGAKAVAHCNNGNLRDISTQVRWSGTGSFSPPIGSQTKPSIDVGNNAIILSFENFSKSITINGIRSEGYAAVGDISFSAIDAHSSPTDPHFVKGPIITGAPLVSINGSPAAFVGSHGVHAACPGPNTFMVLAGDPQVLINGRPAARLNDQTKHCGGAGSIIEVASISSFSSLPQLDQSFKIQSLQTQNGTIQGEVKDLEGESIERVLVVAEDLEGNLFPAWTNNAGQYEIRNLKEGPYKITCNGSSVGYGTNKLSEINVALDEQVDNVDCVLPAGATISGIVIDDQQNALGRVWVHAIPVNLDLQALSAMTSSDGSFFIPGLSSGEYYLYASGELINLENRYFPSTPYINKAVLVSAISNRITPGIVIALGAPDLSLVCDAMQFSEEQKELQQIAESHFLSIKKALRTLSKNARLAGIGVKKFTKRIRNQSEVQFNGAANSAAGIPSFIYSNCSQRQNGCMKISKVTIANPFLINIRKLSKNLKKIDTQNTKISSSDSAFLKKLQMLSNKRTKRSKALLKRLPEEFTTCGS